MRENHIFLRHGYTYTQYDSFSFIHPLYISVHSHARDCSVYHGLKYPYFQVLGDLGFLLETVTSTKLDHSGGFNTSQLSC